MVKIQEKYLWAVFIAAIIIISVYFRYYYQSPISINVTLANVSGTTYPLQTSSIPITISNTGSTTIDNISVGLYVNHNATRIYKAYLPAGKQATVHYNFTPSGPGTYNISIVADPSKFYDIVDRQSAQSSITVVVPAAQSAEPYSNFPINPSGQDIFYISPRGYVETLYFDNFTKYFYLTGSQPVNEFLYPALDLFSSYINRIVLSHAYYSNYSLDSIWIQGYISPSAIDAAATGKGINFTQYNNISVMNFGNSTTLCTWYSRGWTKTLVSIFGENCTAYVVNTTNKLSNNKLYYSLINRNDSLLNYSGYSANLLYSGDISINSNTLLFESLMQGSNFSNICYGNILNESNKSYCLQTLYQGNVFLDQMNRLVGDYNISTWWIPTSNTTQQSINNAVNLSNKYNFTGNKIDFVSAYSNRCYFSGSITCQNPTDAPNATDFKVSIDLTNKYDKTITLNKMGCALVGNFTLSNLGINLLPGKNATVVLPCYNYGKVINSSITPDGIPLEMKINYTYNNAANTSYGFAYMVK